VLASIKLNK